MRSFSPIAGSRWRDNSGGSSPCSHFEAIRSQDAHERRDEHRRGTREVGPGAQRPRSGCAVAIGRAQWRLDRGKRRGGVRERVHERAAPDLLVQRGGGAATHGLERERALEVLESLLDGPALPIELAGARGVDVRRGNERVLPPLGHAIAGAEAVSDRRGAHRREPAAGIAEERGAGGDGRGARSAHGLGARRVAHAEDKAEAAPRELESERVRKVAAVKDEDVTGAAVREVGQRGRALVEVLGNDEVDGGARAHVAEGRDERGGAPL